MDAPIVTVITPHYDCAHYLHEAMASILTQTFRQFELYIVDDSSPNDEWLEVVREFADDPRVHVYRTSRNVGPYRIANRVIRMTHAPFIAFQDADDRSDRNRLEKLLAAAERMRADVVGSAARYVDPERRVLSVRNLREPLYDYRRRPGALTMSEATGHGSAARESYIERVFAPGRRNARSPVESDIEFELFPVQPTTRRN